MSTGASAWPAARRRAPRALLLIAATLGVASLAAAGAGIYEWRTPAEPTPSVVPVRAAPSVVPVRATPAPRAATPAEAPPAAPLSVAALARSQATPERARPATPAENAHPTSVQIYAIEAGLLEPARSGIASSNYAGALAAIGRHQREYPRGQLAEEREALRVRALWGMGQKASAESAAATFRKRYPRSVLLSWMKEHAKQAL